MTPTPIVWALASLGGTLDTARCSFGDSSSEGYFDPLAGATHYALLKLKFAVRL